MDAAAAAAGISIELLGSRHADPATIFQRLSQSRPDALVCLSPRTHHAFLIAEARRLGIPVLLTGSRLLAVVPRRLGKWMESVAEIRLLELPFEVPPLREKLVWNPRFTSSPAHVWMRDRLVEIARAL